MPVEAAANIGVGCSNGVPFCHDDKIERRKLELAEGFAGQAAQPVAVDGARRDAAGNGQSKTGGRPLVEPGEHSKETIGRPVSTTENT